MVRWEYLIKPREEAPGLDPEAVHTMSEGYNHYCLECATRDVLGERPGEAGGVSSERDGRTLERETDTA